MAASPIVEFYAGRERDHQGRWLRDIWAYDLDTLEDRHDYIQVLFPNERPSPVNPAATVLDRPTIDAFLADPHLRENLAKSHDLMLCFYGLDYDPTANEVRRRPDFAERAVNWLRPGNHNHLRITRILLCLSALGLRDRAAALLRCLEEISRENPRAIADRTLHFWRSAVA